MATISDLTAKALEIRAKFAGLERQSAAGARWSRADLMRGFIADVGALSKLTMAADGLRKIDSHQEKSGHEFADCLSSILVLAKEYDVDIEREFDRLCSELSDKLPSS